MCRCRSPSPTACSSLVGVVAVWPDRTERYAFRPFPRGSRGRGTAEGRGCRRGSEDGCGVAWTRCCFDLKVNPVRPSAALEYQGGSPPSAPSKEYYECAARNQEAVPTEIEPRILALAIRGHARLTDRASIAGVGRIRFAASGQSRCDRRWRHRRTLGRSGLASPIVVA